MKSIVIRKANLIDAEAISNLLIKSQWFTYQSLYSDDYIQQIVDQYYNIGRIKKEIILINEQWHGYYVAEKNSKIVGVISGGITDTKIGEIYVFYLNPYLRNQGLGTILLNFYTKTQKFTYGAEEQWVAVAKGNDYAIPFYESRDFVFQYERLSYGSTAEDQDISLMYKRLI